MIRRSLVISGALCLAGVSTFAAREASACSCEASTLISPFAGSTDVPVNAVVVSQSYAKPSFYDVTHGVEVPATIEPFEIAGTWLIRPNDELAANTLFQVRPTPAPGNPFSQFTTGATSDDVAPTSDSFTSLGFETVNLQSPAFPCRSSCLGGETFHRLRLGYAPPPSDTALLLVEIRREPVNGAPSLQTVPLFRHYYDTDWPQKLEQGGCSLGVPTFDAGDTVCARIVAFDMAGHRSEPSAEVCSRAIACVPRADNFCSVVDECIPETGGPSNDAGTTDATPVDIPSVDGGGADGLTPQGTPFEGEARGCSLSRGGQGSTPIAPLLAAVAAAMTMIRRRQRRD